MSFPDLNSPQVFFMITGLLAEAIALLFYRRFRLKARRLSGTGRVADIEVAHNWRWFCGLALIAIPILFYALQ